MLWKFLFSLYIQDKDIQRKAAQWTDNVHSATDSVNDEGAAVAEAEEKNRRCSSLSDHSH